MSGVRLARARDWGRIIFISSESGVQIPAEMVHYGLTKSAQLALSRGIAESVAGTGVTVNAVLPGPTRSEGVVDFLVKVAAEHKADQADVEAEFRTMRPSSIIRRFAEPDEVANLVVYLPAKALRQPQEPRSGSMAASCAASSKGSRPGDRRRPALPRR
jgi:NAD(P)-dependent dehydrogenase (short-subunit alcohol dehydrogenase family)